MALSILIVEDDDILRHDFILCFAQQGYFVEGVGTLSQAQAKIDHHNYDLYLIDGQLPDGDGRLFCEKLKRTNPAAKIVFLSAHYQDMNSFSRLYGPGVVDCYLMKPVELEKILLYLKNLLESPKQQDAQKGLAQMLAQAQGKYRKSLIEKLVEVEQLLKNKAIDQEDFDQLYTHVHKIHGTAGSYGFKKISEIGRKWEAHLREYKQNGCLPPHDECINMLDFIDSIKNALQPLRLKASS